MKFCFRPLNFSFSLHTDSAKSSRNQYPQIGTRRLQRHIFGCVLTWALFAVAGAKVCGAGVKTYEAENNPTFAGTIDKDQEYAPGEVLVLLSDEAIESDDDAEEIGAKIGGVIKKRISLATRRQGKRAIRQAQSRNRQVLRIKLEKGKSVKQVLAEKWSKKDPRIVSVEPNYRLRILIVPNDPFFGYLWAMQNTGQTGGTPYADIDAVSAWNITTGSDNVVVAVVDTGIDYLHSDLAANMWTNTGEIPGNSIDDDDNGFIDDVHGYDFCKNDGDPIDEHSHGTHCAGTIAARGNNGVGVTGVNWRCKLMACRFLDENGSGYASDAIDAINYAVANGADILSNSWGGGGYSATMEAAITNARDNGVLFVAAAGNSAENGDLSSHYPSGYAIENVIAVAATNHNDELASFSNYGLRTVHLGAPGVSILSTVINNEYSWYNGTSMATPHVAGAAALLLANDPTISVYELKSRLIWTGDEIEALSGKTITGRRLNVYNALTAEPELAVLAPNEQVTWVQGFEWPIEWKSIGGADTVDIYLLKGGEIYAQLADDASNTGKFTWQIPGTVAAVSDYRIFIDDGVNTDESDADFAISDTATDYLTQLFSVDTGQFDLSGKSLLLTPDDSASEYTVCLKEIDELPVEPGSSTNLGLGDDDSKAVTLTGHSVQLYGTSYDRFYVGSNGYITFESADDDYSESLVKHFNMKRISGLFRDFNPSASGSVLFKQLGDRAAVTWQNVPEYGRNTASTFQVEMFYDGTIRLSWLSVGARYGIAGVSRRTGTPIDFTASDISDYQQCQPELESVEVIGPDSIAEQSTAQFACTAHYDDGSTQDITSGQAVWSENSDYAEIDETGLLTAAGMGISTHAQCSVTATIDGKSDSHSLVITPGAMQVVTVQKCRIKAGRNTGYDAIKCSGTFGLTAEDLAGADSVTVQIYSGADNYLVYEESIGLDSFTSSKGKYRYKHRVKSGQPGAITSLAFDTNKNMFNLLAKNVDLTGLASPLYLLVNLGTYTGLGIAGENTINGRKSIPVALLSGYADTLSVTKTRLKNSSTPGKDKLGIKGTFSVADDSSVTEGLTITWGYQTLTVPGSEFDETGTGRLRSIYQPGDGSTIKADFDLNRCVYKIAIKETTLTSTSGSVDFGLEFGSYSETEEVRL